MNLFRPRYKILEIKDGIVTNELDLESIKVIPSDGMLLFTMPVEITESDFEIIKEQIRQHFEGQRTAIMRSGDMEVTVVYRPFWVIWKEWVKKAWAYVRSAWKYSDETDG
jgi:hypothetical protein